MNNIYKFFDNMNDILALFSPEDEDEDFEMDIPLMIREEEKETREDDIETDLIGILPIKNTVLFPGVVIPITVGREKSIQVVKDANRTKHKRIGVLAQRNPETEDPQPEDLYEMGTVARILKLFKMPDGSVTVVIQGRSRFNVLEYEESGKYLKAKIAKAHEVFPPEKEVKALTRNLRKGAFRIIDLSPNIPQEAKIALENIDHLGLLAHFIASNLNLEVPEKQALLEVNDLNEKSHTILKHLDNELDVLELSVEIQSKVKVDMDKQQREFMLRQQMRTIQEELGEAVQSSELDELRERAKNKKWSEATQQMFDKEMHKLTRLTSHMPDYAQSINYLEWLLDLPWQQYSEDIFNFGKTQKILDNDHTGLEKPKERILEYLAVLKLKNDKKAPILCFYGPPGVGKTSLAKSIAKSLGRDCVRISLGGVRDEAEIRGHRRTYISAMPGKVIQGMRKAKTGNPVFVLDEIDKVGNDHRGDPSSALLEVLDPEQNNSFQDHYLEVEYDLSRVMFIATANSLATVHPALRDRLEIIEINGYSLEEKMAIAKKHLIPTAFEEHGLKKTDLKISDKALQKLIEGYTRESGVRKLAQQIATLCRAAAKRIVMSDEPATVKVTDKNIEELLGTARFENESYQLIDTYGVCIGLAWTPVGGDILFIESTLSRGKGHLSLTGQLGDVMRESATLAYTYLKSHADSLNIPYEVFEKWDVHLHVPAGAIPKDGPSAGITMLTTLASLFTRRKVKGHLAMSGEITLRGKVLPVGGIKEKVLAAARIGIKTIILSKENAKDVREIKENTIAGLTFHYITNMMEVLNLALENEAMEDTSVLLRKD